MDHWISGDIFFRMNALPHVLQRKDRSIGTMLFFCKMRANWEHRFSIKKTLLLQGFDINTRETFRCNQAMNIINVFYLNNDAVHKAIKMRICISLGRICKINLVLVISFSQKISMFLWIIFHRNYVIKSSRINRM